MSTAGKTPSNLPEAPREIFHLHRFGYAGDQPAVWMDDWRQMRSRAERAEAELSRKDALLRHAHDMLGGWLLLGKALSGAENQKTIEFMERIRRELGD